MSTSVMVRCIRILMEYTHNFIASDFVDLAPSLHNEAIVRSNDSHNINSFSLELLQFLDVGRQVVGLATGSKGTWKQPDQRFDYAMVKVKTYPVLILARPSFLPIPCLHRRLEAMGNCEPLESCRWSSSYACAVGSIEIGNRSPAMNAL